ncbi:hypothetical protein JCM19300_206 [Algibacter lectus]|uniref:Uncharacterized protein n=1 Tax=Algibacter lectus TaxID=221126 RepID=A0A090WSH6_9FLAO|nr:hypothetical protein JCM19300_206 [Algibacter lectus]GAL79951.1 hypothetical protein JCM19274_2623 [Algibacter lectus]
MKFQQLNVINLLNTKLLLICIQAKIKYGGYLPETVQACAI